MPFGRSGRFFDDDWKPRMTERANTAARHKVLIEEPSRFFKSIGRIWPWFTRTFHRDLGLRGFSDLAQHLWTSTRFDRRYGVRTQFLIPQQDLEFEDKVAQSKSARHRSTPPFNVSTSLQRLSERIGGLRDQGLVDYGCGSGRVLILAAEAGIGHVTGVELSPHLVDQGRVNLDAYKARFKSDAKMQILQVDATKFVPPPEASIFYFFSPFHIDAFDRALDCIRQSVREHPRDIYVMLFMCSHFTTEGLELIGEVVGVQTLTNALDREAFVAAQTPAAFA